MASAFADGVTPTLETGDGSTYTLGGDVSAAVAGQITHLRYYEPASQTGTVTLRIWNQAGTLLASVEHTRGGTAGFRNVALATPIDVTVGERYRVGYDHPGAGSGVNRPYPAGGGGITLPHTNGDLTVHAGYYATSLDTRPTNQFPTNGIGTNYFADVVFAAAAAVPTVNAGADATVDVNTEFARTATEDDHGETITSRAWTIQSGPTGVGTTIGTDAALSWTPTVAGSYVLRYTATNANGPGFDEVTVAVADPSADPVRQIKDGTSTAGTFDVAFDAAVLETSRVAVFVYGDTTVTPPAGGAWSSRSPQVETMGLYLFDAQGDGAASWVFGKAGGTVRWVAVEIVNGVYVTSDGNRAGTGDSIATPALVPSAGTRLALAMAAAFDDTTIAPGVTWSGSYTEMVDAAAGGTVAGGVAKGPVTAWDGAASTTTTATFTKTVVGSGRLSTIIAAYEFSLAAPGDPTVTAGQARPVVAGSTVPVDVTATPPDGETITGYAWSRVSGPTGTITDGAQATAQWTPDVGQAGVTVLQCVVTASGGGTALAEVTVATDANVVAAENRLPGTARAAWDLDPSNLLGAPTLQGFADGFSANRDEVVSFKIADSAASGFTAQVFRLGWYGGDGARLVDTLTPSAGQLTAAQSQPAGGNVEPAITSKVSRDCSNWSESLAWTPPSWAASGVYVLRLARDTDQAASHVLFILRDDARAADVMLKPADSTWQGYNAYGTMGSEANLLAGNSLYYGTAVDQYNSDCAHYISYDRPIVNRAAAHGAAYGAVEWSTFFTGEYPAVRWLERNGYDVKYYASLDAMGDPTGALLSNVSVAVSVGHDEYWSDAMRAGWEAARDAGTSLIFGSGNEVFWRTVGVSGSEDADGRPRTVECWKSTIDGRGDTQPEWTGTWRDSAGAGKGGDSPENLLTAAIFAVNGPNFQQLRVPYARKGAPMWRGIAAITALTAGQEWVEPGTTLGFEWDTWGPDGTSATGAKPYMAAPHPRAVFCSEAEYAVSAGQLLNDAGDVYNVSGTVNHRMVVYPGGGGALVWGTGTVNWALGLDSGNTWQVGGDNTSDVLRQAAVNMLADMGAQPATLMAGLTAATAAVWFVEVEPASAVATALDPTVTSTRAVTADPAAAAWAARDATAAVGAVATVTDPAAAAWTAHDATSTAGPAARTAGPAAATWAAQDAATAPGSVARTAGPADAVWAAQDATAVPGATSRTAAPAASAWAARDATATAGPVSRPVDTATAAWAAPTPTATVGPVSRPADPATAAWSARDPFVSTAGSVTAEPAEVVWTPVDPQATAGPVATTAAAAVMTGAAVDPTAAAVRAVDTDPAVAAWSALDVTATLADAALTADAATAVMTAVDGTATPGPAATTTTPAAGTWTALTVIVYTGEAGTVVRAPVRTIAVVSGASRTAAVVSGRKTTAAVRGTG